MAQKYGVTPWGKWFIDVLDSYRMGARLDRGRSYANTGKVTGLVVEGRTVTARVQGHSRPYYKVKIEFPALKEADRIFELIEKDALLLPQIAAGELPGEFLDALKRRKIPLIPEHWEDMKRFCSCPDWGDPCKHMAAVYYILAREIDADPHILFKIRGIDLASRFGTKTSRTVEPPFTVSTGSVERNLPDGQPAIPECGSYLNFILSLLPDAPPFSERNFTIAIADFYHHAMRAPLEPERAALSALVKSKESTDWSQIERRFADADWEVLCDACEPGAAVSLVMTSQQGEPVSLSLENACRFFLIFSSDTGTAAYRFFFWFFRLMRILWNSAAFAPVPFTDEKTLRILWHPLDTLPTVRTALDEIARYEPALMHKKTRGRAKSGSSGKASARKTPVEAVSARSAVDILAGAFLTERVSAVHYTVSGGGAPFQALVGLFFSGDTIRITSPALHSLPIALDNWLSVLRTDFSAWRYRFTLKAAKSRNATDTDSAEESASVAPIPAFRLSFYVLLEGNPVPLKSAAEKAGTPDVLRAPATLANYLPEIRDLSKKVSIELTEKRLVEFLDDASRVLSRLGVEVVVPKQLHRELKPRLIIRDTGDTAKKSGSLVSYLDLDSILSFEWAIAIGDTVLSLKEFRQLVRQKSALVSFHDGFVLLDPEDAAALLKKAKSSPSGMEFIRAHLAGETVVSADTGQKLDALLKERTFPEPAGLAAKLRPYQKRGYEWVCSLLFAGFGCILADDMGLGKTVQAITVLLRIHEDKLLPGGCLIIVPAAVIGNWEEELARFAPNLTVSRYHGPGRSLSAPAEVFLTTYQTAVRDAEKLTERQFSFLITDEAHLMKNADTAVSRTVKSLPSRFRLALSGTPVENRLEDMRSLFDFALPGYLGTPESFRKEFRVPIEVERNPEAAARLRAITGPFLLRRLKTDRSIIADLPEKVVINEYPALEKGQAALYENIVQRTLAESGHIIEPRERSALILTLLTSLKQICDHPRVYDGETPAVSGLSGKCGLLLTLLDEILANNEKVLIFSQYVETLRVLETIIMENLEERPLLYYGGMTRAKRDEAVQIFQNDRRRRIMLISLKAGGLGLNLTAASRVIHFDLWYNPSVENQATDRAFRIGQTRNVFVHRFVTRGTFEEKIDAMLTSKRELAEMTVASGESWLAKMSHEELTELFRRG